MRFLFLLTILFPSVIFCQSFDSLNAVSHLEKAKSCVEKDLPDSAFFYAQKVSGYFLKKDDLAGWLGVSRQLAKAFHQKKEDVETAIEVLKKADGNLPRQPVSPKEWEKLGWFRVQIGYLSFYGGKPDIRQSVHYYEAARTIFEEKLSASQVDVGRFVYQELGNLYTRLGDYQAAQITLEKAKRIGILNQDDSLAAEICSDLSLLFIDLEKFEEAIAICSEGLTFKDSPAFSKGLLQANLAKAWQGKGIFSKSLQFGKEAEKTFKGVLERNENWRAGAWLSDVYSIIGSSLAALKKYAEAEIYLKTALQTALDFYAPDIERREIAKQYGSLGNFYLEWNKPRLALEHFQRALQSAIASFDENDPAANPLPASFYPENAIKEALLGKAACFEKLYEAEKNPARLRQALRCRSLAFEVGKELRQVYQFESSKLQIIGDSQHDSERAIELALRLHRGSGGNPTMLDSAFLFSEINKSVLLHEALKDSDARSVANIPEALLKETGELQAEIADLEKSLFKLRQEKDDSTAAEASKTEEEILRKRQRSRNLTEQLEEDFPAYSELKQAEKVASVREVQRLLRPDQALIEYFVGDSNLFIFLVKKDAFTAERLPKNFPLERWVAEFRQGIEVFQFSSSNRDSLCQTYTELSQKLYQKLLQPLEKQGLPKNLIIVPGGILGFLPFDALLTEAPAEPCRFRSYPYLVRRHAISYNYSSTLFKELSEGKRRQASAGFAAFAPQFSEGNASGFGALQFNISSAEAVREQVGGKIFPGAAATGQAFLSNAEKFRLLYLATHAKANTDEGDFSFIVLAGSTPLEGGRGVSGFDTLFVKDIYNLPLSADLVFLGACETGSGKMHNGEGIISLARSFLYAGARSIVTTLWSINDESNKNLTISFFRHLSGGERKDVALQLAKLEQLENSPHDLYAHPVFWAAYTPIGNMEAVEKGFSWWMVAAGIGIAGLAFFAFKKFEPGWLGKRRMIRIETSASQS